MAKNSNSSSRNQRNNPYLIEGWAVDFHRSKAGIAWRWRTELTLLAALLAGYFRLAAAITTLWALITFAALITAALAIPALAAVPQAPCLVPDLPAPPPAGLLRGTAAHPGRTAPADPLDPPDQGRRTRPRAVPRGDLRR